MKFFLNFMQKEGNHTRLLLKIYGASTASYAENKCSTYHRYASALFSATSLYLHHLFSKALILRRILNAGLTASFFSAFLSILPDVFVCLLEKMCEILSKISHRKEKLSMILKNFVVFEGLDGTGTTSQLRLLQEAFAALGRQDVVLFTCEPTDDSIGKLIRQALSGALEVDAKTVAYLFGADRCEHIYGKEGIVAQLQTGKAVFSDRYLFSSLAYQGLAAGKELARVLNAPFPLPEYLFFFDLPAKTAMERIEKRNLPREIYEKEAFQQKVADEYHAILRYYAETAPDMRIIRIDAAQSIAEIHEKIWSIVGNLPIV